MLYTLQLTGTVITALEELIADARAAKVQLDELGPRPHGGDERIGTYLRNRYAILGCLGSRFTSTVEMLSGGDPLSNHNYHLRRELEVANERWIRQPIGRRASDPWPPYQDAGDMDGLARFLEELISPANCVKRVALANRARVLGVPHHGRTLAELETGNQVCWDADMDAAQAFLGERVRDAEERTQFPEERDYVVGGER